MKKMVYALFASFLIGNMALAADTGCEAKAVEKKLAGAAKNSFVKKCEKEAVASNPATTGCEASAKEKKLAGAAKNSFMKKCVADSGAGK